MSRWTNTDIFTLMMISRCIQKKKMHNKKVKAAGGSNCFAQMVVKRVMASARIDPVAF